MGKLKYKIISEGLVEDIFIPLTIVYADLRDIAAAGLSQEEAVAAIARNTPGPAGINLFDMDAVTTTSDGVMVQGAIVRMAASDNGKINPDFGMLTMAEIPYSDELVELEPHLLQWKKCYPGKKLLRGPDPATKLIPVHNVVITGRAANNNSATEMMNIVTMNEIILPIMGQLECMRGGDIVLGLVGEVISVGIGMTVSEQFGRIFPTRQFRAGETAHGSGIYAKTLKKSIPCIVCDKSVLAKYSIQAIEAGCVPGRELGCSPALLSIAKHMGAEIALDNISAAAWEELASIGVTRTWLEEKTATMTKEEIIASANDLIPGVETPRPMPSSRIVREVEVDVG